MEKLAGVIGKRIEKVICMNDTEPPVLMLNFTDGSFCLLLLKEGRFSAAVCPEAAPEILHDTAARLQQHKSGSHEIGLKDTPDVRETNRRMCSLFIRLWTKASPTEDYVKAEWGELDNMLTALGMRQ